MSTRGLDDPQEELLRTLSSSTSVVLQLKSSMLLHLGLTTHRRCHPRAATHRAAAMSLSLWS